MPSGTIAQVLSLDSLQLTNDVLDVSNSKFTIQAAPGLRITIEGHFRAPAYDGNYDAPQRGSITKIIIRSMDPDDFTFGGVNPNQKVLGTTVLTGHFPTLDRLFTDAIYGAQAVRSGNPWMNVIPDELPVLQFKSATEFWFYNTNGTVTALYGTGLKYSAEGFPIAGKIDHLALFHQNQDGTFGEPDYYNDIRSVYINGGAPTSVSVKTALAGLFDSNLAYEYFTRLFAGVSGISKSGTTDYADSWMGLFIKGFNLSGDSASETFSGGLGKDHIDGKSGNDVIKGLMGNDTLIGGKGADKLTGGLGADDLYGNSGADRFIFASIKETPTGATKRDVIHDFSLSGGDVIDLHLIDANTKINGEQNFKFIGSHAFTHHAGELHAVASGGKTLVEGDVNGDGKADFQIELSKVLALKVGDFDLH